jgi:TonB family protein
VSGPQVQQGNNAVDTGATGQGAGLASGGRIAGGEATDVNFCCPDYLASILNTIDSRWNRNQPERGTTVVKFTVLRDGTIANIVVERRSGYGTLDRMSTSALQQVRQLPPLPAAYTRDTLTVHLTFPYGSL